MTNKIKLQIEEILPHTALPFAIYDKNNRVICHKGDIIDSKLVSRLSLMDIYKLNGCESNQNVSVISRISKETADFVVGYTREFWDSIEKKGKLPNSLFYEIRDRLLGEVTEHINKIQHLGELRVYYDDYNISHAINVCSISTAIGIKLGYEEDKLKELALGGLLHDIGKTQIPKQILNKPGKLSYKEFEVMKLHSYLGYKIIKEKFALPECIAMTAMEHQEKYDGSGYSKGLATDKILKYAQIVSLADTYDASISDKVYATAKGSKEVIKELLKSSNAFNPRILYTLVHMINYNTGNMK